MQSECSEGTSGVLQIHMYDMQQRPACNTRCECGGSSARTPVTVTPPGLSLAL